MHRIEAEKKVRALNARDLATKLQKNGFPECGEMIVENGIDGKILMLLTELNLRKMKHNLRRDSLNRLWTYISRIKNDPGVLFEDISRAKEDQNDASGDKKTGTVKKMVRNMERSSIRNSNIVSSSNPQESPAKFPPVKLQETLLLKNSASEEQLKEAPNLVEPFSMEPCNKVPLTNARKTSQVELIDRKTRQIDAAEISSEDVSENDNSGADYIEVLASCSTEAIITTNTTTNIPENYSNDEAIISTNTTTNISESYSNNVEEASMNPKRSAQSTTQVEVEESDVEEEYDVLGMYEEAARSEEIKNVQVMTPRYASPPEVTIGSNIPRLPEKPKRSKEIIPKQEDLYEHNKRQITKHSCFFQDNKKNCETLLANYKNGSYLVRPSETFGFVLMVKTKEKCCNIPIRVDKSFALRQEGDGSGNVSFESFEALLKHYCKKEIKLQGGSAKLSKENFII